MQAPKRKTSKSKRNMRRSHHSIAAKLMTSCLNCGEPILPHHACSACGHYRGRKVLNVGAE